MHHKNISLSIAVNYSDYLSHVSIGNVWAKTPAPVTQNRTCLGHLRRRDTDRIVPISCRVAQGGQGNYYFVSLLLTF
jgi:hypothetical protein